MRPTTSFAVRRVPTTTDGPRRLPRHLATATALALLSLAWASPADAKVEWIGRINGENVYLIWGGECSALDPPNDNVVSVTITYTGPPQPGVFMNVQLYPPFDTYTTDSATFLTVTASTPMPLPCPTCFEHAFSHATTVPLDPTPGAESPFQFVEYNTIGGFCAGTVLAGAAEIPAMGRWASAALTGAVLLVGIVGALRAKSTAIG